jgi:hypothetical protein
VRAGIDDRRPELGELLNGDVLDLDALDVGDVEQVEVHVLANDADPHPVEPRRLGVFVVRLRRRAPDAEGRELVA